MCTQTAWWRTLSSGLEAAFWMSPATQEQTRQEADFIQ